MIVAKIAVMCPAKRIVINETVFVKLLLPGKQEIQVLFYIDRKRDMILLKSRDCFILGILRVALLKGSAYRSKHKGETIRVP